MTNNIENINGLTDGISVLENNKLQPLAYQSDMLYNEKEPFDLNLKDLFYEEKINVSSYYGQDFGEAINLLSTTN